ncbi:hypothetical protein K501DRAFT_315938 [Backusella circina FSU 941]|nr:hypothetical protein K501DRAFT_315938 [Backusella circina FSU 941]
MPITPTTSVPTAMESVEIQGQQQLDSVAVAANPSLKDKLLASIADTEKRIKNSRAVLDTMYLKIANGDVNAITASTRLTELISEQEKLLDTYQARLDKFSQPVVSVASVGSSGKGGINLNEFPEFNPKKWVSNAQESTSLTDLDTFIDQFEFAFIKHSVSLDTNWYRYLLAVMQRQGDEDQLWIQRIVEAEVLKNPKVIYPWSWAKRFLKHNYEYSIASDFVNCFQKIISFKLSVKEPFVNMLNRYISVAVATQVDITNCFDIIRIFLCKLNHYVPEFCEKMLLAIYNRADQAVVGAISKHHVIAKDGKLLRKLIPCDINDFFVLVSTDAKYLSEEWNKAVPTLSSPSSASQSKRKDIPSKDKPSQDKPSQDKSKDEGAGKPQHGSTNGLSSNYYKKRRGYFKPSNNFNHGNSSSRGNASGSSHYKSQPRHQGKNSAQINPIQTNDSSTLLPYDSDDEFISALNNLNDHAAEGNFKSKVYCDSITRSSYTMGDTDNPFNINGSDIPTVTPIILQNTEVYGILDPGSEISAIRIDFANKLNIRFKPLNSQMEFINGQVCSRFNFNLIVFFRSFSYLLIRYTYVFGYNAQEEITRNITADSHCQQIHYANLFREISAVLE